MSFGSMFARLVAEKHRVVHRDLVAELQQLRNQQAADVAGASRDQHMLELHARPPPAPRS